MKEIKLLLIITLLLTGCSNSISIEENTAEAIYWHESKRYSAAVVFGDVVEMRSLPIYHDTKVILYIDVKSNDMPWYKCSHLHNEWVGYHNGNCEIHIKSIDSLSTADWNHGKFGSGATTRIN